jgi:Zn-dependent membrane protease YugP
MVLDKNGLSSVPINIINGNALTNYYDPRSKSLNLSSDVARQDSVASISVACHEVGHAMQDAEHYPMLALRNTMVPVVNLTQTVSIPLIIIGILLTSVTTFGSTLFNIGVICFCVVVAFHLVTLPVELNASSRALKQLDSMGIVDDEDYYGSKKVLSAAAMTYIAALAMALANLLRILVLSRGRD